MKHHSTPAKRLTPWFPGDVKPARKGVYERKYPHTTTLVATFCLWNGRRWFFGNGTLGDAGYEVMPSAAQSLPWRGLAVKQ